MKQIFKAAQRLKRTRRRWRPVAMRVLWTGMVGTTRVPPTWPDEGAFADEELQTLTDHFSLNDQAGEAIFSTYAQEEEVLDGCRNS